MEGHVFQQGRIPTDRREMTFIYFVIVIISGLHIHVNECYDLGLPVITVTILEIDII